jgi:uncharacterized protein YutE (UPF0331/DUF86 family)
MYNGNLLSEESRLRDIAEQYTQRGYKVTVSPRAKQLPRFLSRFQPDLVAEGADESVVIEVKSSGKVRGSDYWKELSKVVQQHPGWRLELVFNSSSESKMPATIKQEQIRQRLQEGQQLAEQGMLAAALLITWSATEAAMRLASKKYEIELPDLRPPTVISRLYTDGVIERKEYDFLLDCTQLRNNIAHGFYEGKIKPSVIKKLEGLTSRLL